MPGKKRQKRNSSNSVLKKDNTTRGADTDGKTYKSIDEMWREELKDAETIDLSVHPKSSLQWYTKAKDYWKNVDPTVDGMLGGLGHLSGLDVETSKEFLKCLPNVNYGGVALDVGAGIGRVSKNLLLPLFAKVDMLESDPKFIEQAKTLIASDRLENYICLGMEDFKPFPGRYSVVWIQWCIIYLTDNDLVEFLKNCALSLEEGGLIVIKDNVISSGFLVDREDSSVSRTDEHLKLLFDKANLEVSKEEKQKDFPKTLFPVKMYVLQKKKNENMDQA